jgi:cytosine/adenosine deaminase-related metal-dependent hydrolase
LSPRERIALATTEGARALRLERIGHIAPGMKADITAFELSDPLACDADPERYLIEHCCGAPAALTLVDGIAVARHGRAGGLENDFVTRMRHHRARVRTWARGQRFGGVANASAALLDSES